MQQTPLVSVIMPVYNRESRVGPAIESILKQTYQNLEFIIVDDGSKDDSIKAINRYAQQDKRIRLLALPSNGGQGLARAIGNDAAKGEFIAIMDSDDFSLPDRLKKQVDFLTRHPDISLCGGQARMMMTGSEKTIHRPLLDRDIKSIILQDNPFIHPTIMLRRAFLKKHNLNYSAERRADDDYKFIIRALRKGAKFANMESILINYIVHDSNISFNSPKMDIEQIPLREQIIRLYYPELNSIEVNLMAKLCMKGGLSLSIKEAYHAIATAEKAMKYTFSHFGEDKDQINQLLNSYIIRLNKLIDEKIQIK